MANTGKEIVLTLKQIALPDPPGLPTGLTKSNIIGDEDYIAPYINLGNCPVTADTTCPYFLASGLAGIVQYEFSVLPSVISNPSIDSIKIQLMDGTGVTLQQETTFTFPMSPSTTYKAASFGSVIAGSHQLNAIYLDSVGGTVASCLNLQTVTTT